MSQKHRQYIGIVTWCLVSLLCFWSLWWVYQNQIPDGYQNEYLHVGNAFDLWEALCSGDTYNIRYYTYTSYWPFGFYVAPWPLLALFGMNSTALILTNLPWLILMVVSVLQIGRIVESPFAAMMLVLCPAVYGTLVRYEPNLISMSWTIAGVLCLLKSHSFRDRSWVLLWATCLGLGLMMDRLSVAFFLVPAVLPCIWTSYKEPIVRRRIIEATVLVLLLTFAYYREFFIRHTGEIFSQAPVGEIDSHGMLTEPDVGFRPLYYFWVLLDSQTGPFIGVVLLVGWFMRVRDWWKFGIHQTQLILFFASVPGILFFTLLAKKQVYYSLPALAPLILLARPGRLGVLAGVGGFLGFLSLGIGVGSFGQSWVPEAWVAPRHVLVRPPSQYEWRPSQLAEGIAEEAEELHVFSTDSTLYEGYLMLLLREQRPKTKVRGVVLDPKGVREFWFQADYFVWLSTDGRAWPTQFQIEQELVQDYGYEKAKSFPPIAAKIARESDKFQLVKRTDLEQGTLWCYKRIGVSSPRDDE